jgi:hypothetical protein
MVSKKCAFWRINARSDRLKHVMKTIYLAAKILYGYDVSKDSEERQVTKAFVLATGLGAGVDIVTQSIW